MAKLLKAFGTGAQALIEGWVEGKILSDTYSMKLNLKFENIIYVIGQTL